MGDDTHQHSDNVPTIEVAQAPPEEKHQHQPAKDDGSNPSDNKKQMSQSKKARLKTFLQEKLTKKEVIIGGVVFVLLLSGSIVFGLTHKATAPQAQVATTKPKPQPTIYTSPLTGLTVTKEQSERPVTGVMIENSIFARPQSGLREAGVVFEAIAEGGITRFLALSQESSAANVGPIRSARPYFLQWALGFDAPLAHVGGSPEALSDIKKWHVKDLDEFYNGGYYHRISSREAPHNMYTSIAKLNALEKTKGWVHSSFTGFQRKKESPAKTPTASSIDFSISGPTYGVHYTYAANSNSYARFEGGAPHLDATTGKQLYPKVVIAVVMPYSLEKDGYHSDYNTLGSGKVYVFQDGTVTVGTWHKATTKDQFSFLDAQGKTIKLNAGQTWITAVGASGDVTYKP